MNTYQLLNPPRFFSHENLEFGNIIKINFEPIKDAIGYLIEVSEDDGINFKLLGYSKDNFYIDYSITNFSDYNIEYNYIYRVASISNLDEVPSNFSKGYKVTIPKKPSELEFSYEGEIDKHSKIFNIFNNKENKLLVQNIENNLEVHKLSMLNQDPEKNKTIDYILSDTSSPIEIKEVSDDFGFYVRYSSGTIQYINKTTLSPYITLNTYGKNIKKFEVNQANDLIVILEDVNDEQFLTIYKKEDILIKKINFTSSDLKHDKILDLKIKENILYILDANSEFFIYEIDRNYGTLKFIQSIFNSDGKFLMPFNIFKKKSYQYKNNIINYFKIDTVLNEKEKNSLEFLILNNELHNELYDEITKFIKESSTSTNNKFEDFKSYIELKINSIFLLITQSTKNNIDLEKLNLFFNNYLNSQIYLLYTKRIFDSLSKYYNYEKKYLEESKILISETNNIIIISSCYYIYFLDLKNYKINEYFNCLLPIKEIENIFLNDYNIQTNDELFNSVKSINNDRFIYDVKYFEEANNIGIYFEDISTNYILNETKNIIIDPAFSYQYIDFYNIDFNGDYTDLIIDGVYNENFTSLKGFGYEYIQKYGININLHKSTIYVYKNKFYKCLSDRFFFDRNENNLDIILNFELENNFLIEIPIEKINHFSLNTRLYITSKEKIYDNRNFSFFDIDLTEEYNSEIEFSYLNGKKIFNNNILNNQYCKFEFDCTGENIFIYNNNKNYYGDLIKCANLFLFKEFFLESNNIIFKENINIKHFNLSGTFNDTDIIPTTEPFNFVCSKRDNEGFDYIYLFDITNLNPVSEQFQIKLKPFNSLAKYFIVNALYKKKIILDNEDEIQYFYIYNEHQTKQNEKIVYGNTKLTTWRWKRNNDILKYDSYLSIRVSIDKENWNYFNKDINSYTSKKELNDGIHTFYLQFQNLDGQWSKTIKSIYYLKTLKPSQPILEDVIYDSQDRGKPLFKWNYDPEVIKYKIIYDDNLIYYPIYTNYHSPEISFNLHGQENKNINVNVISYDKYSNESEKSLWKFNPNNSTENPFEVYFNKQTNNKLPLFRWKNISYSTITEYVYSFNNEIEFKTKELFCNPMKELNDGINIFSIYAIDSLGQKTDVYNYNFEVKTDNPLMPELTEDTIKNTKNCNLNKIIFNFDLHDVNYKQFYSFDNFKNTYQFNNYSLNLSNDKNLKEGNNTIYFKFKDEFNNESEILEYVFYINSKEIKTPIILNSRNVFSNIPKIYWTNNNNIKNYKINIYFKNELIFEEETINSFWTPLYNLKNGDYTLNLNAIDYFNNVTKTLTYEFIVDDTIPDSPSIENVDIKNNEFYLKINKIKSNENSFYRIKNLNQIQNSIYQKFNNFINIKNLNVGDYLIEIKLINDNSFESKTLSYQFSILKENLNSNLSVNNLNLEFKYDKINNEIKIISYKDFNDFKKILINEGFIFNSDDIEIIEGE